MEQASSSAYPNILVVDYVKKARVASPQLLAQAEHYLGVGYQTLLTFERPGGGFDWWGSGPSLVWLSAYGLHEFNDMAKVYPIDRGVIDRTQRWLMKQRAADGTWTNSGATHSAHIEPLGDPKLLLTSYVVWSLLESGVEPAELKSSLAYIRDHVRGADNAYVLALAANALTACDAKAESTCAVLKKLEAKRQEMPAWKACCFPAAGQSLSYARGDSLTVETTALAVLAMLKNERFHSRAKQALAYLVKSKDPHGTWGSTQATILALKTLVAASIGRPHTGRADFSVRINGKEAARGAVTEDNADVLQRFDLKEHVRPGANAVTIEVKGETNLLVQVVGRHFEPRTPEPPARPVLNVAVVYERTKLSTKDLLRATATVRYHGRQPTYMVIVDLAIPPGFTADGGDFAAMVSAGKVKRFSMTSRQVTLYLGDVRPGDVQTFAYKLRPKYPLAVQAPAARVYEYYTPAHWAESRPVSLVVDER